MAAPKRNTNKPDDPRQAKTRASIQTTQLINRLQGFALGANEAKPNANGEYKKIELDTGRIKAIEILLRKSLPDLQSITLETGEGGFHITWMPGDDKV